MMAWVEWHWTDFKSLAKKNRNFDCNKCSPAVQKIRRCRQDKWDNKGGKFPIKLNEHLEGYSFCPAKLFRDDPIFTHTARHLFLAWKLGKVPFADSLDTMPQDQAEALLTLIHMWSKFEKAEDFRKLATLLTGSTKSGATDGGKSSG